MQFKKTRLLQLMLLFSLLFLLPLTFASNSFTSSDLVNIRTSLGETNCSKLNSYCDGADINQDGAVNINDLMIVRGEGGGEDVVSKDDIGPMGICESFFCNNGNYESNEGPGGEHCCSGSGVSGYEECENPFVKSTAHLHTGTERTDYCSNINTLIEYKIDCAWGDDIIYSEEIDCNDHDEEDSSWTYYCTSDEVRRKKYVEDWGCSEGRCKIKDSGWLKDELVRRKGHEEYCEDRKSYGCSLCGHGDYECDWNSECSGSLVCKGTILGSDGCCWSDEWWDGSKYRCCECEAGVCCNGCDYKSSNTICDDDVGDMYNRCEGNSLDDDILVKKTVRYCSGTKETCTGRTEEVIDTYENCDSNEYCSGSTSWTSIKVSCKVAQCTSGECCDTTPGVYRYESSSTRCSDEIESGCPWGTNLGDDAGVREVTQYCSGSSFSCSGQEFYGGWVVDDYCTDSEFCNNGECVKIECSSDSDCGTDHYITTECKNNDVWGDFKDFTCLNPGTINSECTWDFTDKKKEECGTSGYVGSKYCQNYNSKPSVFQDYTTRGCEDDECSEETDGRLIKQCETGCTDGKCNEDICTDDCSSGETRCSGNYEQSCGNYDSDSCSEWPSSTSGSGNDDCSDDCSCICGNYGKPNEIGFCSDGKDNDCDGKTDLEDTDCQIDCQTDSDCTDDYCENPEYYCKESGSGGTETLYEYYNNDADTGGSTSKFGTIWGAQSFTTGNTGANEQFTISKIKLKMFRIGNPGTLITSIRATDANGKPTGADLSTGTTDGNTLTSSNSGEWREISMSPYILQPSTKYALVFRAPDGNPQNGIEIKTTSTATYSGGSDLDSDDEGVTWRARDGIEYPPNYDWMFEVWGGEEIITTDELWKKTICHDFSCILNTCQEDTDTSDIFDKICEKGCENNMCIGDEPICSSTLWQDDGCGKGDCPSNKMHQTRTCTPPGCVRESRCKNNDVCTSVIPEEITQFPISATAKSYRNNKFKPENLIRTESENIVCGKANSKISWLKKNTNKNDWLLIEFEKPVKPTELILKIGGKSSQRYLQKIMLIGTNGKKYTIFKNQNKKLSCTNTFPISINDNTISSVKIWTKKGKQSIISEVILKGET